MLRIHRMLLINLYLYACAVCLHYIYLIVRNGQVQMVNQEYLKDYLAQIFHICSVCNELQGRSLITDPLSLDLGTKHFIVP